MNAAADTHSALMREMGSPNGWWDPIPPSQHRGFLPRGWSPFQRYLAWVRSKTIGRKMNGGKRTAQATDERGKLTLVHAAQDLGWDMGFASRICAKVEAAGFTCRDENGVISLCGNVPAAPPKKQQTDDEEVDCTVNLPKYLLLYYQQLTAERRKKFALKEVEISRWQKDAEADAIAAVRHRAEQLRNEHRSGYGMPVRKGKKRRQETRKGKPPLVQLELLSVPNFDVQKTGEFVQTPNDAMYNAPKGDVQQNALIRNARADLQDSRELLSISSSSPSSSSVEPPRTTTTETPSSQKAEEQTNPESIQVIIEALQRAHCPIDDDGIRTLIIIPCRKNAPDCTYAEITERIDEKRTVIKGKHLGYVGSVIARMFKGESHRARRARAAAAGAETASWAEPPLTPARMRELQAAVDDPETPESVREYARAQLRGIAGDGEANGA